MKILFLCSGNSTRSIMAQALANYHGGGKVKAYSAGSKPGQVNAKALSLLARAGIDTHSLYSKHLDEYRTLHFDVVVTLCDEVKAECEGRIDGNRILAWDIASPSERESINQYEQTLFDINEQVKALVNEDAPVSAAPSVLPFYKALSDEIRLKTLALLMVEPELCVCELLVALEQQSQPKVSRHLAQLKQAGILCDRKYKQWVFYAINPTLPQWMVAVINTTVLQQPDFIATELARLHTMGERPQRQANCCD
ncbi:MULTISPECIES: metalloregulator ArsR/SmtB family transcription factor [unclassified Pseudoalteromonas]|uniref:metalloregulator ArsR/SmtB family transcription factor n=1 Tax=unclassified Pseudoalteromonas TaxID=194690 RepID=UPI0030158286